MPKAARPPIELTDAQRECVRQNWKMDLRELIQIVFQNPELTLRSKPEVTAVKKCLAGMGYGGSTELQLVRPTIQLSDEVREYVQNNHESASPLELVRTAYKDQSLTLSSPEGRAVLDLLKEIDPQHFSRDDEPVEESEYKPPRNLNEMIARVNALVPNPVGIGTPLYQRPLNSQHEKNLNMLHACVRIPRFIHQASQYLKKVDRELFESSFLGQIHDKIDLTREDIEQYITYCASIVSTAQTERTIQRLQGQADDAFEGDNRVSMVLVEHLAVLNKNLQDEKKRQEALYKTLTGARSSRLNDLTHASASMHPLVQKWREKEGRERLLRAAQGKRKALAGEVERLSEMDSIRCEIWGLSQDEILK